MAKGSESHQSAELTPPNNSSVGSVTARSPARCYAVAVLSFGIALTMQVNLPSGIIQSFPFGGFFLAVIVSAWYGGLGPGLLTTALSGAASAAFFPASVPLPLASNSSLRLLMFLALGSLISFLNGQLREAHRRREAELLSRQRSLSALRESEDRYRIIAEAASDGIVTIDEHSTILFVNEAGARLFGYNAEDLIGNSLTTVMPEHLRRVHEASFRRYLDTGKKHISWQGVELPGLHKSGVELALELSIGESLKDDKRIFMGVVRDITARKKLDEQLRHTAKLESLGILAGGVAHDFNNLLTGILGNASLAADSLRPENPARQMIRNVIEASERASHLTRQLLAYAGKGRFVIEPLDASKLVREISALIVTSIPKNVQLRLELDDSPPALMGDAGQLQQVIMNLVINGAEAIPAGVQGTVLVRTGVQDVDESYIRNTLLPRDLEPGRYVTLEVQDTGVGMDEPTKERIFDPFFTTKFTGRGLGLAAVLGIVRGHKGALKVYSALGQGTSFKVLFPAAAAGVVREKESGGPRVERKVAGLILVVDDEEIVRKLATMILEGQGCRVETFSDGLAAVERFERNAADVSAVLLDLTMPGMGGEETLRRLKQIRPNVKVILSSGYNETEVVHRFAGKGLCGFIQKPYSAQALVEVVRKVLTEE
jgi:PAS domain S-box-containing protein